MSQPNRCDVMADEIIATYQLSHTALLQQARARCMPLDVHVRTVLQPMVWRHILAIVEEGRQDSLLGVVWDAPVVEDLVTPFGKHFKMRDSFLQLAFWSLVASIRNRLDIRSITTSLQPIEVPSDAQLASMFATGD